MLDEQTVRRKTAVALLSVVSNTSLVVLKLIVGVAIGSVSVLSEAIHSGVDLVASVVALMAVRVSGKHPDDDHPFGHGKYENLSGAVEAVLIFLAAGWIIYEAVHKFTKPAAMEAPGWGVLVMLASVIANTIVSRKLFKVGRETESLALQADGWHLRTDVYTSLGVMVALGIITVGEGLWPSVDLHWVDPLAAILVALLIIKAAWELTAQSVGGLVDTGWDPEELQAVEEIITTAHPAVAGFHHLRTRQAGPTRHVEVHLLLNRAMHLDQAHQVGDVVTNRIRERFPTARVLVHAEPCDDQGNPV